MTLGAPPKSIGIRIDRGSSSSLEGPTTFPRYRFTTEYAVTTNPETVEHTASEAIEHSVTDSGGYASNSNLEEKATLDRHTGTETSTSPKRAESSSSRIKELSAAVADNLSPTRSKASTPKIHSRQSVYTSPREPESETDWESEDRGRTRARLECIIPPRSRKISRRSVERHVGHSKGGSGSGDAQTFLTSESPSPSNSSKEAQDLVLEPSPTEPVARGFSQRLDEAASPASPEEGVPFPREQEVVLNTAPFTNSPDYHRLSMIEAKHFQGHRDTFAILSLPKNRPLPPSPPEFTNLPYPILRRLNKFLDHRSRLALRLTSRWLRDAFNEIQPLHFPAVSRLPAEMIHEIFLYMSPYDFNSARHTCRAWMRVSLDKNLLARMFRKAGWWSSVEKEMRVFLGTTGVDEDDFAAVWHLSTLLSRECALSFPWSGNGLSDVTGTKCSRLRCAQVDGTIEEDFPEPAYRSPFELVLETDFSALNDEKVLGHAVPTYAQSRGLRDGVHFTASVCGRFVLVTQRSQVFVYQLSHAVPDSVGSSKCQVKFSTDLPTLRSSSKSAVIYPVTTIICPRRVLAVSMDTSCGRYAVAVLLDDRMGLVCDLFGSGDSPPTQGWPNEVALEPVAGYPHRTAQPGYTSVVTPGFLRSDRSVALPDPDSPTLAPQLLPAHASHQSHITHTFPIPIETGPRSIYRALCSNDDPPLSIAICPQRRCVAFGCSSGIELHWVDALTGQDLNRWFPLTAPSDYLFFLPPRKSIDNAKKLRLVSSSGLPSMKGRLRERFTSSRPYSWGSSVGMGFGYGGWRDNEEFGQDAADNYRSIPLSDGYHVVFTDPVNQKICLGLDAPGFGPHRMTKKVVFEGPKGVVPTLYAAGRDLSWGVRVAAGFGDEVWMFTVPADIFSCESNGEGEPWLEQYVSSEQLEHIRQIRAAKALLANTPMAATVSEHDNSEDPASVWPVTLSGVYIGTVPDLSEIAINSRQVSFTIWAFASDGAARAWQVRGGKSRKVRAATALRDGSIAEEAFTREEGRIRPMQFDFDVDADGDVIMEDAPPLTEISIPGIEWSSHTTYDGYMSRTGSMVPSRKASRRFSVRAGHEAPPTTPVPATSPTTPATPILQGVDAVLREDSTSPISLTPSPRSDSGPLPNIIEHEVRAFGDIVTADLDEEGYWTTAGEEAKKEAWREQTAGLGSGTYIQSGRIHPFGVRGSDIYGAGYESDAWGEEDAWEEGQLDIEILG